MTCANVDRDCARDEKLPHPCRHEVNAKGRPNRAAPVQEWIASGHDGARPPLPVDPPVFCVPPPLLEPVFIPPDVLPPPLVLPDEPDRRDLPSVSGVSSSSSRISSSLEPRFLSLSAMPRPSSVF